jgi:hypothetical protein
MYFRSSSLAPFPSLLTSNIATQQNKLSHACLSWFALHYGLVQSSSRSLIPWSPAMGQSQPENISMDGYRIWIMCGER